jgi:hypothetical protein
MSRKSFRTETQWWRCIAVAATAGLVALGLADCSPPTPPAAATPSYALVVAGRTGSVPVTAQLLAAPVVADVLSSMITEQAWVSVISDDGAPRSVLSLSLATAGRNQTVRNGQQVALRTALDRAVTGVRAGVPEADDLTAIALAARSVSVGTGRRTIVIESSGLSTVAPLRFQDHLLDVPPATVAAVLAAEHELPDLSGDAVEWLGLGQTSPPQDPLNIADIQRLQDIWAAVLTAAHAAKVRFITAPLPTGSTPPELPRVTPVHLDAVTGPTASPSTPPSPTKPRSQPSGPATVLEFRLDGTEVAFVADRATLRDPGTARANVASTAIRLLAAGARLVTVTGTCALPCAPLDLQRAAVVAGLLIDAGIPRDHIRIRGVGTHFTGFVPDLTPAGQLSESAARRNRLVIVTAVR